MKQTKQEKFYFDREWNKLMQSIAELRQSQRQTDEQMKRS